MYKVVVRSEKEKRYFHQKSIRNVEFVIWSISEPPPLALQNNDSIVIVTDLYPIDESIQWWLAKLSRPFIAGIISIVPARPCTVQSMSTITHSKKFILKLNLFWSVLLVFFWL